MVAMTEEARLEPVESGLAPVTPGWFVVNAGAAAWMNNDRTQACCIFESDDFVLRYGASVERDTTSGAEANAPWRDHWRVERPETWGELPWSAAPG